MKRVIVLSVLIALMVASFPVAALDICVGGKAGLAHSGYMGEDHKDYLEANNQKDALWIRAIVGAFVTLGLSEHLQIQPELLLVGSGGKAVDEADPSGTYWEEKFTYLSLPVLIKGVFSFTNGDLFVFAAPAVQFALTDGSEAGTEYSGGVDLGPYPVDLASFNFSAMAGAGYNLAIFGGDVSIELRYIQGLSKSYDIDEKHRTWSIALIGGYGYRIK